jgi:glycosyltransferase involved in cell wall biosynthesis
MKVGLLASHPIQYLTPLLRELSTRIDLHVYYAHNPSPKQQAAAGFDVEFKWDTDLMDGYSYTFLNNIAKEPDARVGHFWGCDTPGLHETIISESFDAFIVNGWYLKTFWQAVWACKRAGTPVLARGDSQLQTPRSWPQRMAKEVGYRGLLRVFDGFLSVGNQFDRYLMHYGISSDRIFRVPHCVDNAWFATHAKEAKEKGSLDDLRQSLELREETSVILFVGKFIKVKRADDILKALQLLNDTGIRICAVYVGSGPCESRLRSVSRACDVETRFVGFKNQSELPAYYSLAEAIALPSQSETWGLVINEAMACGTPAIVSDAVGCAPDLIIEGETGYQFPVGKTEILAQRVEQLLERKEEHDFEAAVQSHIQQFSVEAAAEGIVSAVQAVAR